MTVNLSIKNVPDELAEKLRARAKRSHRSLQGELMAMLEATVASDERLSPVELLTEIQQLGISTPAESIDMIRADRDRR